jgi:hypothetical protein
MGDDLIERLRTAKLYTRLIYEDVAHFIASDLGKEAAARLRAENERIISYQNEALHELTAAWSDKLATVEAARDAAEAKAARLETALEWYKVQVAHCRKHTTDGFEARAALGADGGDRARAALEDKP